MKKFNINDEIYIKLTDKGLNELVTHNNKYLPLSDKINIEYYKKKLDKDGYYKMQMWYFMHVFGGDKIFAGQTKNFETTILIDDYYLR